MTRRLGLTRITDWLDRTLRVADFDDVSNNGLQIARSRPDVCRAAVAVDASPRELAEGIAVHFGGSAEALVRAYFAAVRESLAFDFDVVGHPDLVRKFNLKHPYFDESASWYREELERTSDAIAASGKIVEVNTGAISRGWLDDAYPSAAFRDRLRARGVKFILSADAHAADAIDCAFDRFGDCEVFLPSPSCPRTCNQCVRMKVLPM